jgi:hypothetical protein
MARIEIDLLRLRCTAAFATYQRADPDAMVAETRISNDLDQTAQEWEP